MYGNPADMEMVKYITSISKQLSFSLNRRQRKFCLHFNCKSYKMVEKLQKLKPSDNEPGLSSFTIELIVAYLDINKGIQTNIEEGIIRFFEFVSSTEFPEIIFKIPFVVFRHSTIQQSMLLTILIKKIMLQRE
jgi:hypothetical protein